MSDNGQSTKPSNESPKGVSASKIVIIVLLVTLLIAAVIIIFLLLKPDGSKKDTVSGRGYVLTEDNASDLLAPQEDSPDDHFKTSQTIDWHFKGKTSEDAYVANDSSNSRTVYFDLLLNSTQEVIYSSPYIPLGSEMKGVTLDKELDPGTYETIMVYHLVDDDENEITTVSVALDIYVE